MSEIIKYLNGKKNIPLFFLALLLVFFFVFFCFIHYSDGDDSIFEEMTSSRSYFEYLKFRYETWTGRMGGESLVYLVFRVGEIWFWRLINSVMVVLLPLLILELSAMFNGMSAISYGCKTCTLLKQKLKNWDILRLFIVLFSGYLLMDVMTFGHSVVWVNGSLFYTWSIVFALCALIPVMKSLYGTGYKTWEMLYAIPCTLVAVMSVEQIGVLLFAFTFLSLVACKFYRKKIHGICVVQLVLILVSMIILLCAPGNELRMEAVYKDWLPPEYLTMNIGRHLFITYQWLISSFASEGRLFFLCIWIASMMLLAEKGKCTLVYTIPACLFIIVSLLPFAGIRMFSNVGIDYINPSVMLSVLPSWSSMTALNVFALFWWTLAILFTFILLWKSSKSIRNLFIFGAAIASECVMYFSPTIYASGERVYFIASLLFMFIMVQLWMKLKNEKMKNLYVFTVFLFGILNILNQFAEIYEKLK